jgi:hypothetical protein
VKRYWNNQLTLVNLNLLVMMPILLFPNRLPQQGGFAMLIVGKPRSGKTNLLLNLTTKAHKNFNRKFDRVFIISPSIGTMENDPFELLPDDQKYEVATEQNINTILGMIKDTGEKTLLYLMIV